MWIDPMVINHEKGNGKIYFNCIIQGNYTGLKAKQSEEIVEGKVLDSIMEFADIQANYNFGVVSLSKTKAKPSIAFAKSPEQVLQEKQAQLEKEKAELKLAKLLNSKSAIPMTKDNVIILNDGMLNVSLPGHNINQPLDFAKIWSQLEKHIIGKIQEGDVVTLTDNDGNVLFEIQGGSFLNVALADLNIYDKNKAPKEKVSPFNFSEGLKGGLFIREDGSIHVGDYNRTFYLKIYTNRLLKASLKLNKPLSETMEIKALK